MKWTGQRSCYSCAHCVLDHEPGKWNITRRCAIHRRSVLGPDAPCNYYEPWKPAEDYIPFADENGIAHPDEMPVWLL